MTKISLYVKEFFVNGSPGETGRSSRGEHDDHDEQAQGVGDDEPLPGA
jgi:hypothetical protein